MALRDRAIQGAVWIVVGVLARHILKLGSSLALTRVLFPEAFGLVATAGLLTAAVEMCSDLGIRQAIVQHRRGATRCYLDSAWTMRVIRGVLLAAIIAALARPFAAFFAQPILHPIVLVISIGAVLRGLTSPAILLLDRKLSLGKLITWEVCSDVVRVAAAIVAALVLRSVWGLVIGGLVGEVSRLAGSFLVCRYTPRLCWDRTAARELFRYGRFVLLSSIIGYGATRLDVVFVAKFLGMERAGIYYIAVGLATVFNVLFTQMAGKVLFPAMSRCQEDAALLRKSLAEVLRLIGVIVLPLVTVVALNADSILRVLYDTRYIDAALALRWLCVAVAVHVLANTLNSPLMATGRPYFGTVGMMLQLVILCASAPVLGAIHGVEGYAMAVALAAGGFLSMSLLGCSRHDYMSPSCLLALLARPACFAAFVACIHVVAGLSSRAPAARLVAAGIEVALLASLWVWQRGVLLRFRPRWIVPAARSASAEPADRGDKQHRGEFVEHAYAGHLG